MKKVLSLILAVVLCIGVCFSAPFTLNVSAASVSDLTFKLNDDGKSYYVSGCSTSASGEIVIPATYNGLPVTSIGSSAFNYCDSLTSVTIGDSVTSIGEYAFAYCYSLASITIGDSVTSIGDYAFYDCTSLTSITIPDSVTSIGYEAFYNCTSLTSITIPDSVTSIGEYAFGGCESLTSITIPDSVTIISNGVFKGCTSLTSITIPDSVTSIGSYAFKGCTALSFIKIPDSVTSIGQDAFSGTAYYNDTNNWVNDVLYVGDHLIEATTLSGDYVIKSGTKCIGEYAFAYCYDLTSITIPKSVTSIVDDAFYDCISLTSVNITDIAAWCNIEFGNCDANPLYYAKNLYLNGNLIKDLVIPDSVTSIGNYAFYKCTSLTSVTIPDSVTSIGDDAFYNCTSLTSVNITDIAAWCNIAFGDSYANPLIHAKNLYLNGNLIKDLVIPDSVTSIGERAFAYYKSLTSITIGDSVTSIGEDAFFNCTSLTSIKIADSVTSIGEYAFSYCTSLTSITIPDSVTNIGEGAFAYCYSLKSITIPKSVTSIGSDAFTGASNLKFNVFADSYGYTYVIENNLTIALVFATNTVNDLKFTLNSDGESYSCSGFTKHEFTDLVIPSTYNGKPVTGISDSAFKNCTSLLSIVMPETITSIGENAFYNTGFYNDSSNWENDVLYIGNCLVKAKSSLSGNYIIKSGTKCIADYAFNECTSLTIITIPDTVTSVGTSAFYGCNNLNEVYISSITSWFNVDFYDYYANPLYYAKNLYLNGNLVKDLAIPDNVTQIKKYAFYNCKSLASITIPKSVTSIGSDAFTEASNLKLKVFADSYSYTYVNENNLTNVLVFATNTVNDLKFTLNSDGESYSCSGFTKHEFTDLVIPSTYNGKPVTGISDSAFKNCTSLLSIMMPETITSIGENAFYNTGFYNDSSNWENDVLYIGNCLVKAKSSLSGNYIIKSGTKCIADNAFYNCTSLTGITISDSITDIGSSAFKGCNNLKAVYITDVASWCNMNFADTYANPLYYANNLYLKGELVKDLVIPTEVNNIKNYAFYNCSTLASVTIPDSVTSIGSGAFTGVSNMKYKVYPNTYAHTYVSNNSLKNVLMLATNTVNDLKFTLNADGESYSCSGFTNYEFTNLVIPSTYNGKPVTGISASAFKNCASLVSITIPDSVTSIGEDAFYNTGYYNDSNNWENDVLYIGKHLIKVKETLSGDYVIKSGTKSITDKAFYNCTSLTSITIPDSVTSIGNNIFTGCTGLTSLIIGKGVEDISDYKFADIKSLETIVIGDGVSYIPSYTFKDCTSLTSITIPDSVISIGEGAFSGTAYYNDTNNWENDVLYIGNHLIKAKTSLAGDYVIKSGTKSIADTAFENCTSLTSITIPASVISIGSDAFSGVSDIKYKVYPDSYGYTYVIENNLTDILLLAANTVNDLKFTLNDDGESYSCSGFTNYEFTNLVIPSTYNGKPVTSIGDEAFYACTFLTSITIPDSVTNIGEGAFAECYFLTSVTIPASVTSIGDYAFYDCELLTSITIPASVTSIGFGAFYCCTSLTSITIPDSVTNIGEGAFAECTSLTSITIPDSVTIIGGAAFYGCVLLTSITIPDSVTIIGDEAFEYCTSLTSITIPDSVTSIGYDAFENCTSLTSITIPDTVTSIGEDAFYNTAYYNDTNNWENDVLYIGNHLIEAKTILSGEYEIKNGTRCIATVAFYNCTSLTSVTIPDSVTSIGWAAFDDCTSLTSVNITDIASWCNIDFGDVCANPLYYATNLYLNNSLVKNMIIPEGVTEIKPYVFYNYKSVSAIKIPKTLKRVGARAFYGCSGVTTVAISDIAAWCGIEFADAYANPCYYSKGFYLNGKQSKDIVIPDDVTSIGDYAFYNCASLKSITIPDSVTSIGEDAFCFCGSLTSVNITDIAAWCNIDFCSTSANPLYYAENLYLNGELVTTLVIPEGVTSIGDSAFCECTSLTSVTIPDSVTSIGDSAFDYCSALKYVFYKGSSDDWNNISIGSNNSNFISAKVHYNATGHSHDVSTNLPFFEGMEGSVEDVCLVCGYVHYNEKLVWVNEFITAIDKKNVVVDTTSNTLLLDISASKDLNEAIIVMDGYTLTTTPNSDYGYYGTGSKVQVTDTSDTQVAEYTLVVRGDVNGDSVCDVLDLMLIELARTNNRNLDGVYLSAGDLAENGVIDDDDFNAIVNKVVA